MCAVLEFPRSLRVARASWRDAGESFLAPHFSRADRDRGEGAHNQGALISGELEGGAGPRTRKETKDAYLQILLCAITRIAKLAVVCVQKAITFSLADVSDFCKRHPSSAVCSSNWSWADVSTSQSTVVRRQDVDFLRTTTTIDKA